ncbi:hypothetical protein H3146_28000, partial [Streptomyces sp. OF3]
MSDATTTPPFGSFDAAWPAAGRPDLVAPTVTKALADSSALADAVLVVDTDPEKADTAVFCETYDVPAEVSANCVVVAARRGQETTLAACVLLATTRLDVNRTVRRHLGARKASFAPMDLATTETGMEYGGITPLGLPPAWPRRIVAAGAAPPHGRIGRGRRR